MSASYHLVESIHGAPPAPVGMDGTATACHDTLLANWLAARAYFWREQGYTQLQTPLNAVVAHNPHTQQTVVVSVAKAGG